MNLTEIEKIMSQHKDIHICPICSTPFAPRNSRQKTCGGKECRRLYRNEYIKRYNARRIEKDPETVRRQNANAMRKYRQKQKALDDRATELAELDARWQKQLNLEKKIAEYGVKYGEVSAQKVLEKVPKIDVNLKGETHGNQNNQGERERSESDSRRG